MTSGGGNIGATNNTCYSSFGNMVPVKSSSSQYSVIQGIVQFPEAAGSSSSVTQTINNQIENTITTAIDSGNVEVKIPEYTFEVNVTVTIIKIVIIPAVSSNLKSTGLGVDIGISNAAVKIKKPVNIKIPYRTADISGMNEDNLRIYVYNDISGKWSPLEDAVLDKVNKTVSGKTRGGAKFVIMESIPANDFSAISVYPNPLDKSKGYNFVRFENVPEDITLKIFTLSGENIFTAVNHNTGGVIIWESKNDSGGEISNGIYYYHIQDSKGNIKRGKIFVTR